MHVLLKYAKGVWRHEWYLLLLAVVWSVSCHMPPPNPFLKGVNFEGFEQASALVVYNKGTIFDYINGEAEVYLPFGFQLLYSQSYRERETGAQMIVDAYDMGTPGGAEGIFGRYTQEGRSEIQGLGESAWTDGHIVLFTRGRYFLRVWSDPSPEPEMKPGLEDLLELGRAMDRVLEKGME